MGRGRASGQVARWGTNQPGLKLRFSLIGRGLHLMFGLFRKRRRAGPHPHRRELSGLLSCIVAWRRAVIEARLRDGEVDAGTLAERLSNLAAYAEAAGEIDPFTRHVLSIPVGELDEPLFLEALYRMETAVSIAWALGLVSVLPPIEERADFEALGELFPLDGPPARSIAGAKLRETGEISAQLSSWSSRLAAARQKRKLSPGDEASAVQFSHAFERARGLAWLSRDTAYIEDTVVPEGPPVSEPGTDRS